MNWHGFWWGAETLPLYFIALRAVLIYLSVVIATRLLHFRHVGVMSRHNYLITAAVVGISGMHILNANSSLIFALIAIAILTGLGIMFSYLDLKLPRLMVSRPIALIKYGRMSRENLRRANMTIDNLLGQLRLKGAFNPAMVESAYLEATGKVSVIKKPEAQPVFRKQLGLPNRLACPPTQLIYDGKIDIANLKRLHLSRAWLEKELQKQGFPNAAAVFFAALLPDGDLYICGR